MPFFHLRNWAATAGFPKLCAVILLSLPTILGTGFFLGGVILSRIGVGNSAPVGEPMGIELVALYLGLTIFWVCYIGAAAGPLLIPVAALLALLLSRAVGVRSTVAIWAWTFVVMGLAATLLFWKWLINLDIFI